MNKQDILIKLDLDGVIRNWNASVIAEVEKRHPFKVKYPFEDFNIDSAFPIGFDNKEFYLRIAPYEIYRYAKPYARAVEFVELLLARFPNVWLVTTQYPNTMFPTIEWVQAFIPSYSNLPIVFSKEKGSIGKGRFKHTILIDDAPHNLDNQVLHGGTAICFGQLYNFAKPNHNTWVNFFGDTDFSLETEPVRIATQFQMLLDYFMEQYV